MTKKNSKKAEVKAAPAPKKRPRKPLFFAALGLGIGALFTAGGLSYHVSTLPEQVFVNKTKVEGLFDENPELAGTYTSFSELETATKEWTQVRLLQPLELQVVESDPATVTLTALGVQPDWAPVSDELSDFMSDSTLFKKVSTYVFGQTVEVPYAIDESVLAQTLLETKIEQERQNAIYLWDGKTVTVQEGLNGYHADRSVLKAFIEENFNAAQLADSVMLAIEITEPEVTTGDLNMFLPEAQALAAKSVQLQDEFGNTWDFVLSEHIALVIPVEDSWTLDENGFIAYLETTIVPEVEEDPTGVVITEKEDGTYSFEGSARFGKELDKLTLLSQTVEQLQTEPSTLALPLTVVEPSITVPDSLAAKGVTDLVGVGYSDFGGSPANRVHNIQTGIAQYNGILIDQGAEFSFMGQMSPVDAEHGFLPELVIKGDETIPEYGGGLCQISSTMFRAALYSGLPITARRNHSYAVSYYARPFGYGLDATVYDPAPDFKFMNDTPGSLLVQAYTDGSSAYYVFYGTNDGRTVTMEGPYSYDYNTVPAETVYTDKLAPGERELKENSHTGFTTDWYRTVTYKVTEATPDENGVVPYVSPYAASASGVREIFHSVYEARPAKYWEGQAGAEGTEQVEE